eukprot:5792658-Pleurochrysis_carterae.AAC.1
MARAGEGSSSSLGLGRARPRNMPPTPRFAAPRSTTGLTGAKRPLTRAWNTRDEASSLEDRRRDAPRRGAPRHDDSRREEQPRRSRTPESEEQHQSTSPAQSKKQRRSNSPTQSDTERPREREGDEGGRSRERRVGAKSKFSDHPPEEPEMSKVSPPADLISLSLETVHVCMELRVNSLMIAPAIPCRSEGKARQHVHARPHPTVQASVHVDYDRDAMRSSFQRTLEFWRQLEEKAHVPLANSQNDKSGLTAAEPRENPGDHVHVLNSHVRKDVSCPDTRNATVAALQPETEEHKHGHLKSATLCMMTLPNPNPDCGLLAHDEGGGGENNGSAKHVLYMGAE